MLKPVTLWHLGVESYKKISDDLIAHISGFASPSFSLCLADRICPPEHRSQSSSIHDATALLAFVRDEVLTLELLAPYDPKVRKTARIKAPSLAKEPRLHAHLKQCATEWLEDRGVTEVEYEAWYSSGRSDVSSKDRKWFVECGGTRGSKCWQLYRDSDGNDGSRLVIFNTIGITIVGAGRRVSEYRKASREHLIKLVEKVSLKR